MPETNTDETPDSGPGRVLVLFAHPALQNSRVNRELLRAARELDGVTVHDLYEAYPDFDVDVPREQQLLVEHQLVVMQHPLFWYSTPALLKEWQDLVLEHGWAYGSEGDALRGKRLINAVTAGGSESTYCAQGHNRHTVRELLAPIERTAALCGMEYLPPFVVHGTHKLKGPDILRHAEDYARVLSALRDGRLDLRQAWDLPRINRDLDALIGG
jgi:glutathione-regulated potassium-efflux system ancillary protein KefG